MKTWVPLVTVAIMILVTPLITTSGLAQRQPVATVAATVQVAAEMANAPSNCGSLPHRMALDTHLTDVIGAWPLWLGVSDGGAGRESAIDMPLQNSFDPDPSLTSWWFTKVGWFIDRTYTGKVTLRGYNVADSSPMYFHFSEPASTLVTLDPKKPGGFIDGIEKWAFFPSYVWVSKAGCYVIEATWDGGLWRQVISVGHIFAQ